jgi:uncharacterized membrane protein YczE
VPPLLIVFSIYAAKRVFVSRGPVVESGKIWYNKGIWYEKEIIMQKLKSGPALPWPIRLPIYLAGMVILCFGIVLNTKTGLGVAAINSVPYSVSRMSGLTLGTCTFILYVIFIAAQLIIKRGFSLKVVLQLPMALLVGRLVDFFDNLLAFTAQSYLEGFLLLAAAILLTGLGVTLSVGMELVPNAADGMVDTLAQLAGWPFGKMKYTFDISMMCLTCILSLVFAHHVIGIGIGTVFSALLLGRASNLFRKLLFQQQR